MMSIIAWVKRHSFPLWAFIIWLILCVPQNVVMIVMYYYQDFQDYPNTRNYTCYDFQLTSDWERIKGTIIVVIACFGIIGNLFSILVLQRLASKSGFNKLLLALGTQLVYTLTSDWERIKGIIIVVIASYGIIGNLFSIFVQQRLASKSGFNQLLHAFVFYFQPSWT